MSEIDTTFSITPDHRFTRTVTQNRVPVCEENYIHQMNAGNGFSSKRLFRKVGTIPLVATLLAEEQGYDLGDQQELRRFLDDYPEYRTVNRIDSGADGRIIIK